MRASGSGQGRRTIFAAALALSTGAGRVRAQGAVRRSVAVLLRPDSGLKDLTFLPGVTRRMEAALLPPLRIEPAALDLRAVPRDGRRLLGGPMLEAIGPAIADRAASAVPQVVLIAEDMRLPPARFNFAISAIGPGGLVVISLARLAARDPDLTAARVAKMALKNVARVLGHPGSGACVFGFPNSLAELDAMPENYCEPDLGALRAAGLAR